MQVTPVPTPIVPGSLQQQEAVIKAIPQVQAQASAPLLQRAVDPSTKNQRGQQTRSNGERAKGGGKGGEGSGERGGSVNIRV